VKQTTRAQHGTEETRKRETKRTGDDRRRRTRRATTNAGDEGGQ